MPRIVQAIGEASIEPGPSEERAAANDPRHRPELSESTADLAPGRCREELLETDYERLRSEPAKSAADASTTDQMVDSNTRQPLYVRLAPCTP